MALVITDRAKSLDFPIDSESLIADRSGGQVVGLGKASVQKILKRHGITRVLANEGGRTSRGSMNNMRAYVALLNGMAVDGVLDLDDIENFWIEKVKLFFSAKPFKLKVDLSQGLRAVVRHVLLQAAERQKASTGTHHSGAVMQNLVGAKLDCALGLELLIEHHSFSTSDQQTSRAGDFLIADTAIHVTTSPSEGLILRCRENIEGGLHPIIITGQNSALAAEALATNAGLENRVDIFEVEQFIALNIYELGKFAASGNRAAISQIVKRYNEIIELVETDPSLRIEQA